MPEQMVERMVDVNIQTLKTMVVLGFPGAATEFAASAREGRLARTRGEVADELVSRIKAAPDPAEAVEQVKRAFVDRGVSQVWITADAVVEAADKSGNPAAYYAGLGVTDQVKEAAILGGDVRISANTYADLMNWAAYQDLKDHVRFDQDGMTRAEEKEVAKLQDHIDEISKRVEEADAAQVQVDGTTVKPIEQQIEEELFGLQAFFGNAKDAGMTDLQYEKYLGVIAAASEARGKRKEEVRVRKEMSNNTAEMKARRAELGEAAKASVESEPLYQAVDGLGRERLNKEAVVALIGEANLKKLPKVDGRLIYETGGSVDPEVWAGAHGFEGGDIMLFAMLDSPTKEAAIEATTDRMFNERYEGLTAKQQDLENELEAMHNDASAGVLALELNQLRVAQGQKKLKPRILKLAVRERLKAMRLKDINPKTFMAVERREAAKAAKLLRKGDRKGATQAKFRQLLNFQYAQEAYGIRERARAQHKYLRKFEKNPKPGAPLPIDYHLAIKTMLGTTELGRISLVDFVHQILQDEGVVIEIPLRIQEDNGKTHYLSLTWGDWTDLYQTVKAIDQAGREENKVSRAEEKKTVDEQVADVLTSANANLSVLSTREMTGWDRAKRNGRQAGILLFNPDTLFRAIDGFKLGPAMNYIKGRYDRAISYGYRPGQKGYAARMAAESKRLSALFNIYTKKEQVNWKKVRPIAGVREDMSHQRVIMVLLNSGNPENRARMVESGQFSEAELELIAQQASEKDVKFVQGVWDYYKEFWPEIVDSTKRRRNVVPKEVEARPVETAHGTLTGGYFPIVGDSRGLRALEVANTDDLVKLRETMRTGSYAYSMTQHGHTLERKSGVKERLRLDLDIISGHVQQVVYDLEVGDAVLDIFKVLHNREMRAAFLAMGQTVRYEQMLLWFADVVAGEMNTTDVLSRFSRYLRTGTVSVKLGWKVTTAASQYLGVMQSATLVGKRNMLYGLLATVHNPWIGRQVREESGFMAQRQLNFNRDIAETQAILSSGWLRKFTPGESARFLATAAFWPMLKIQGHVDIATWIAAKRQGMRLYDGDNEKAVEHADQMVRSTQSSGILGDRSPFERGTLSRKTQQAEYVKAMVPLMSYFIRKINVTHERVRKTNYRNPLSILNTGVDLAMMWAVEAALGAILRGQFPEEDDEGERDWALWAMGQTAVSALSSFPVINYVMQEYQGFSSGGTLPSAASDAARFFQQAAQGEMDAAAVKSAARVVGAALRVPGTGQAITVGEGITRAASGEDVNAMEILLGPRWRD
jgi:hypothetical protein